jgi:hypothetical protein
MVEMKMEMIFYEYSGVHHTPKSRGKLLRTYAARQGIIKNIGVWRAYTCQTPIFSVYFPSTA